VGDEEAGLRRLAERAQPPKLLREGASAKAESTKIGRGPGVVSVTEVFGEEERAARKIRVFAARTRVQPGVRREAIAQETQKPVLAAREARAKVGQVIIAVVDGVEKPQVVLRAVDEAKRIDAAEVVAHVGRALAKKDFASQHDHELLLLADRIPALGNDEDMNRTALAAALDRLSVPELVMSLRRKAPLWLTVLTYHRVASSGVASVLDDGVVDVTPDLLEKQLAFVHRWFQPIAMDDLLAFGEGRAGLPANPLLVTFDDGYRDNHDIALPILTKHGIRATFFVATDYVERRRLFWWDRVALATKRSPRDRIEIDYPEPLALPLGDARARRIAIRRVQRCVKDTPRLDLDRFIDELEHAAGAPLGRDEERRLAEETVMTWENVLALRRAGMDVQSHTRSHRVLQTLDATELAGELRGSRDALQAVLGERVRAISYPVGKPLRGTPHIRRAVQEAGYDLGFSNGTGVNLVRAFDRLDIRRISMDVALGDRFFRAALALPWLGY
jgi:peptidoglycan/xylan/chitin deacetylase (PgdA/CDA1 family)